MLEGFVVLLSRDVFVVPTQGLGFVLRGRTEGCTCTVRSRDVLDEGAAVRDECERAKSDQHVGQDDGVTVLCLVAERAAVRGQDGKETDAGFAQQLRWTIEAARVSRGRLSTHRVTRRGVSLLSWNTLMVHEHNLVVALTRTAWVFSGYSFHL